MGYQEIYKESQKEGLVEDVRPEFVKMDEKGKVILGRYKGKTKVTSSMGPGEYNQYIFHTDEGLKKFSLGAAADGEVENIFEVDQVYRIEYLGKEKTGSGFMVNQFKIEHCIEPKGDRTEIGDAQQELPGTE